MPVKYYLVTVKYGQVGINSLLSITFPLISASRSRALEMTQSIPNMKQFQKDAFTIAEVTYSEYIAYKIDSAFYPYLAYTEFNGYGAFGAESISEMDLPHDTEGYQLRMELEEARATIEEMQAVTEENNELKEIIASMMRQNEPLRGETDLFDKKSKILLLGGGEKLDENHMKITLNKLKMPRGCVDWHKYDKLRSFKYPQLIHSRKYSDIIIGHSPHSACEIGDVESIAGFLRAHHEEIPGQIQFLKRPGRKGFEELTQTSFKKKIENSLLYKTVHNILPIEKVNDFGDVAV